MYLKAEGDGDEDGADKPHDEYEFWQQDIADVVVDNEAIDVGAEDMVEVDSLVMEPEVQLDQSSNSMNNSDVMEVDVEPNSSLISSPQFSSTPKSSKVRPRTVSSELSNFPSLNISDSTTLDGSVFARPDEIQSSAKRQRQSGTYSSFNYSSNVNSNLRFWY